MAIIQNTPMLVHSFERFLDKRGVEHRTFSPWRGGPLPDATYDAYILTGDLHNVTDGLRDYHRRELELLERAASAKVFASCFSHQMIAADRGGKVERRGERLLSWELLTVTAPHPVLGGIETSCAPCFNIDEVTELPPGAAVLAGSPGCRFQLVAYGDLVLTCQAHPELAVRAALPVVEMLALIVCKGPGARFREFRKGRGATCQQDGVSFMTGLVDWLTT